MIFCCETTEVCKSFGLQQCFDVILSKFCCYYAHFSFVFCWTKGSKMSVEIRIISALRNLFLKKFPEMETKWLTTFLAICVHLTSFYKNIYNTCRVPSFSRKLSVQNLLHKFGWPLTAPSDLQPHYVNGVLGNV